MQITISGKHMMLTPAIEEYARKKIERFPRYYDRVQQVEVVIDREKNGFTVEILTDVEHREPFVSNSAHPDLYACIDLGVDKSIRQLTDHKSKIRDNKHPHNAASRQHEAS